MEVECIDPFAINFIEDFEVVLDRDRDGVEGRDIDECRVGPECGLKS